ncbi:hypothetical protein GCM10025868_42440 [Angustibacter aerolatus]|uniref:Uncharacterized protein n=1 Tax=Angustibacter aerolatus TaxID=1162965 RepID=A0ABQ6JM65_9ACTN|nr:hypothetical protein GCM10025868_42440 [Angustibacter aerolatus]
MKPVLVLGSDSWGPVRLLVLLAVVVVAAAWFATTRTVWGRRQQLVDASTRAARLSGTPVRGVFASGFVVSGLLAALGGLMLTARTGLAVPGSAQPFLLDAFTAVYLGATASPAAGSACSGPSSVRCSSARSPTASCCSASVHPGATA